MGSLGTAHLEGYSSQRPSVGSAEEIKRHGQDFRKHEIVSFSQELERLWGHVMAPWAVSKDTKKKGSLTQGRFGAHPLPGAERDKEKAPVAFGLLFLGEFLRWAFITWNVTEKAGERAHLAVAWQWLSPGLTEELRLLRSICHAYAHFILQHNPSQISSLLDSNLPSLESNLRIPWTLKEYI